MFDNYFVSPRRLSIKKPREKNQREIFDYKAGEEYQIIVVEINIERKF